MNSFDEIVKTFPKLFQDLIGNQKHNFSSLTKGAVNRIFSTKLPISGVYVITDKENNPVYVGRSRNMAQRLGDDHRALEKSQANLTHKYAKLNNLTAIEARKYMFENYYVQMIEVENDHARTLFEVYVAMKINTPFNSFRES